MAVVVALSRVLILSCALAASAGWASAQSVPRTAAGRADLSGTWTSRTMTPLERSSTPEDVARAVRFLLESPAITGTTLLVDGGQHLQRFERDFSMM